MPTKKPRRGRPPTTGSKSTPQIAYRVSAEQRAELEAEGKRLGLGANAVAKLRAFPPKLSAVLAMLGAVSFLASPGCSDAYFRDRAVKTAASEHRCPNVAIKNVVAEDRMHSEFSYWLDVCGAERLYRMDTTTGDRFVDQTASTR